MALIRTAGFLTILMGVVMLWAVPWSSLTPCEATLKLLKSRFLFGETWCHNDTLWFSLFLFPFLIYIQSFQWLIYPHPRWLRRWARSLKICSLLVYVFLFSLVPTPSFPELSSVGSFSHSLPIESPMSPSKNTEIIHFWTWMIALLGVFTV